MKILRKKKLLILSITAIALLTLTIGVSYAYFTATVTGNDSAVVTKIVAGILDVDFTITDRISNDNILLIKDEKREEKAETLDFTVSNNGRGTLDAVYYVYLTDVNITNNLKSPDFKWELIKNDDTVFTGNFSSAETNTDFTITSETNNGIVIPVKQELSVGQVDRYKLRIWLSETEGDQNSLLNGSFSGKVRVTSTQLTGSEKYVVFKDQSGTQLGKKIISDGKTNYTMDISSVNLTGSTNIYCNNGGIPTISNNTLNIDGVTNEVECKISNDIQDTIANQLSTTKTGIVMTNNQDIDSVMTISVSKEIVIDLNGKELVSSMINSSNTDYNGDYGIFKNFGNFVVNDSVGSGKVFSPKSSPAIYLEENSEVEINGGSFKGRYAISTDLNPTIIINEGTFESNLYDTINVGGSRNFDLTINGGEFINSMNNHACMVVHNTNVNAVVNINGGHISSDNIAINTTDDNKAMINISGGTFNSSANTINNNAGTINITGGYFESVNNYAINNVSGTINVTGGTFISQNNKTMINRGTININNGNNPVYIKAPNVDSQDTGIYNYAKSSLNINADRANKCTSNSSDTVSGLCIYSDTMCIKGNNKANITINGGTYISRHHSIASESATYKIKNAYIKSTNGTAIFTGLYYVERGEGNPGTYNICSSTIQGYLYDLYDVNATANISYANDNIFSNGTNTPASNKIYGTVNPTGAACSW